MPTSRKPDGTKRNAHQTAALIAEIAVNVVDISRGGCLLETARPFDPGTVGTLQLAVNGHVYIEDFRVARCTALSGRGSTYRVGLEFLRTRRTADTTLRHAIAQLVELNAAAASGETDGSAPATRADRRGATPGPSWNPGESGRATVRVNPAVRH